MDFVAVLDQVIALLRQRGRLTYRTLQRQFQLDEVALEDLTEELLYGQRLAVDEDSRVLVCTCCGSQVLNARLGTISTPGSCRNAAISGRSPS